MIRVSLSTLFHTCSCLEIYLRLISLEHEFETINELKTMGQENNGVHVCR